MAKVFDWLKEQASDQLDKLSSKVDDGEWFDILLGKLKDEAGANLDGDAQKASLEAIALLGDNKDLLVGLGTHAFGLLLCQITCGRDDEAVETYIRALSNADDLIALMNAGSDGVIKAKMELDLLHANGRKLTLDLLTAGMRYLLPFLLSLI
jgi:hypothetical protein